MIALTPKAHARKTFKGNVGITAAEGDKNEFVQPTLRALVLYGFKKKIFSLSLMVLSFKTSPN